MTSFYYFRDLKIDPQISKKKRKKKRKKRETKSSRMAQNKEEAERALKIGLTNLDKKNYEKALKMFRISDRLEPSEKTKALILQTSRKMTASEEQKTASTSSSPSRSSSSSSTPSRDSDDKKEAVGRVLKARTHYERLEVTKTSSSAEIKKSYRKLALQLHPDKNSHPKASEAFKAVGEAFDVLSDDGKREAYNLDLTMGGTSSSRNHFSRAGRGGFRRGPDDELEDLFRFMFRQHVPTYRTHRPPSNGQHQRAANHQGGSVQSILMILLNVLFLAAVFFPMFSSLLEEKPLYSLHPSPYYSVERRTQHRDIPYFVGEDFASRLADLGESGSLQLVEDFVGRDYLSKMQSLCAKEKQKKLHYEEKSQSYFILPRDRERYRNAASELKMPGCDFVKSWRTRRSFPEQTM